MYMYIYESVYICIYIHMYRFIYIHKYIIQTSISPLLVFQSNINEPSNFHELNLCTQIFTYICTLHYQKNQHPMHYQKNQHPSSRLQIKYQQVL